MRPVFRKEAIVSEDKGLRCACEDDRLQHRHWFGICHSGRQYISAQFSLISITFKNQKAVLSVVRDDKSLAGGADESIMTGCYEMSIKDGAEAGRCLPFILCRMAQGYYSRCYNYYPPVADYTDNKDGTLTIKLYETVQDGDGAAHTSISTSYTVDLGGVGNDDILGIPVNLRN